MAFVGDHVCWRSGTYGYVTGRKVRYKSTEKLTCRVKYICERITQQPDLFLDQMKRELSEIVGIEVSLSTVWRALRRLGITYKVVSQILFP
jgi:transposase